MLRQRVTTSRRLASPLLQVRKVVIPPRHSRNTIASRDPDRPLPPLPTTALKRWGTTLPIFALIIGLSAAAIFNYEKSSSSVVNSTLYALRTNPQARELLGDEIYFRDKIPWIWGELHPMRGTIDVGFAVKGTKEAGFMRFKSLRRGGKSGKVGSISLMLVPD